jgi:cysteine desulfurase/selenocysteine lyase
VDFLAAGAHKWLLGPLGIGILYVKKKNLVKLAPVLTGWKCVKSNKNYLNYDLCFLDSAKFLEPGGINITGIIGLHAAMDLLLGEGINNIAAKLIGFRKMILPALREKGYEPIGPMNEEQSSGITSFISRKQDLSTLRQQLDDNGFVVSLRESFGVGKCIRISPHFYNTEDEITALLARLPNCPR